MAAKMADRGGVSRGVKELGTALLGAEPRAWSSRSTVSDMSCGLSPWRSTPALGAMLFLHAVRSLKPSEAGDEQEKEQGMERAGSWRQAPGDKVETSPAVSSVLLILCYCQ
ncbi:hypothetical protein Y1Q_0005122 [Alligator mississippiensis]|uniref:Uncharacterized protein n=1 Tax=Alligator mississippiensis TaxID=8496 RepID=A0A151MZT2_ALLMI|nr:hypothetical protein Y1Q_0005122 [Alligator mississippiensis]